MNDETDEARRARLIEDLSSPRTHTRLRAARDLASAARPPDRAQLHRALSSEPDPWVRMALEIAVANAGELSGRSEGRQDRPKSASRSAPRDDVATFVLHEMEPILGKIRHYAAQEIAVYEESRTRAELEHLADVLDSVTSLLRAGGVATSSEFDLAALIGLVHTELPTDSDVVVELAGPSPLLVVGDPGQARLAISNGVRNAVESSSSMVDPTRRKVLITWGETDRDVWVTVLDRGDGLAHAGMALDGIGTSKPGHQGVGLAIARRAVQALGGELELVDRPSGGARFEIRWNGPGSRGS